MAFLGPTVKAFLGPTVKAFLCPTVIKRYKKNIYIKFTLLRRTLGEIRLITLLNRGPIKRGSSWCGISLIFILNLRIWNFEN
jgi:hypothetical protein